LLKDTIGLDYIASQLHYLFVDLFVYHLISVCGGFLRRILIALVLYKVYQQIINLPLFGRFCNLPSLAPLFVEFLVNSIQSGFIDLSGFHVEIPISLIRQTLQL